MYQRKIKTLILFFIEEISKEQQKYLEASYLPAGDVLYNCVVLADRLLSAGNKHCYKPSYMYSISWYNGWGMSIMVAKSNHSDTVSTIAAIN